MLRTVESRWGPCTYFEKDEYVGKSIRYYGEYNPDETEMILDLAGNGICLDIGANIGCISQALLASGHHVIAWEPQPEVFKLLVQNLDAVSKNFEAHNAGLGSARGTAYMPKVYYSAKGNFGGLGINQRSPYGQIEVDVQRLDDTLFKPRISFIKIDVEGFEREVLIGGRQTIKSHRPILYIEDDRINQSGKLREYIKNLGYTIEEHKPTLYRENNFFGLKRNVWDKNYASHNLICRPC